MRNIVRLIVIFPIKGYKKFISPLLGHRCRYYPTCSDYSIEAIQRFGVLKGGMLAIKRILSCNPFGGYGYMPVPTIVKGKRR